MMAADTFKLCVISCHGNLAMRHRIVRLLALFLITGLVLAAVAAPPTEEEIVKAIQQLGDDDFDTREKASHTLWLAGKAAEPHLKKALTSTDAEIATRARKVLDKLRFGIAPETPKDIGDLIL